MGLRSSSAPDSHALCHDPLLKFAVGAVGWLTGCHSRLAGEQRFAKVSNEDRLAELESLQEFLGPALAALDEVTAKAAAPAERVRRLLQAPDKRATLLEMAGGFEIAIVHRVARRL